MALESLSLYVGSEAAIQHSNEKNICLTCIGTPETDEVKIVYNAKHLDYLEDRVI